MPTDWFIPFFRINKLRVQGDRKYLDDQTLVENGDEDLSQTEEPTETDEYDDIDLMEEDPPAVEIRRSWMQLLNNNLSLHESSDSDSDDLPSLTSYSSSSSSGGRNRASGGYRFEI